MRSALRGTEVIPPADGWARLERELGPHPRISVLRSHWPRIAAAAAAVLIFLGGGGYLLHENRDLGDKGFVIATATDSGSSAADMAQVDGTPAGDGEGTLAGALRAAVPTEMQKRFIRFFISFLQIHLFLSLHVTNKLTLYGACCHTCYKIPLEKQK